MTGEHQGHLAVRPAGGERFVGDGDVGRGARGALVAQGRGQTGARQALRRVAARRERAVRGELGVADAA